MVDKVETTVVDDVGTSSGAVEAGGESTMEDSDMMVVDVADIAVQCPCIQRASTSTSSGKQELLPLPLLELCLLGHRYFLRLFRIWSFFC